MPKKKMDTATEGPPAKVLRLTDREMLQDDVAASEDALRTELQKIVDTKDPRKLFGVDGCTEDLLSAASATRIRLIKMSHPDRARHHQQALWQLRNEASAHINDLWKVFQRSLPSEDMVLGESEGDEIGSRGSSADHAAKLNFGRAEVDGEVSSEIQSQNDACAGRFSTGGAGAGPASEMLEQLWQRGELLRREELQTYIGFGEYRLMQGCVFEPLGTNRAVNVDVVQKRVQKNLESLREKQRYCDFGTISLCVVAGDDMTHDHCAKYYILDGQHRIAVMQSLKHLRPNVSLPFQLRCKVVSSNKEATEELFSMQDCHPPDPRCFFENHEENEMASLLLDFAKIRWPQVFKADKHAVKSFEEKRGSLPKDPARPFLNDGLFFDLIRDFGVLKAILHLRQAKGDSAVCAAAGLKRLEKISDAISSAHELGDTTFGAAATWESCRQKGCFLGMYKYDKEGERLLEQLSSKGVIYSSGLDATGPVGSRGGVCAGLRIGEQVRLSGLTRQVDLNGAAVTYKGPMSDSSGRARALVELADGREISVPNGAVTAEH